MKIYIRESSPKIDTEEESHKILMDEGITRVRFVRAAIYDRQEAYV